MSSSFVFRDVQPGTISAILFIVMDLVMVGFIDVVLSRIVCIRYYKEVNKGIPLDVRSADIPGISSYLLGRRFSVTNILAILVKVLLLVVIFIANINIQDETWTEIISRDGTFNFDPSDKFYSSEQVLTVKRRSDRMRECIEEIGLTQINYYPIRFNLEDGLQLENDYGVAGTDTPGQYDIDDETLVCLIPSALPKREHVDPFVVVKGCTRPKNDNCYGIVAETRAIRGGYKTGDRLTDGEIYFYIREYSPDLIKDTFSEYVDPRFTCLSTEQKDIKPEDPSEDKIVKLTHCLLIAFNSTDGQNSTIVERWYVGPNKDENIPEAFFIMSYPGVIFDGIVNIGREASIKYLRILLPTADFRTLSGDIITESADYKYLGNDTRKREFPILQPNVDKPVTIIQKYVVGLVAASIILVTMAFILTLILGRMDNRPRFNTINGISSIVREEYTPSGHSLDQGQCALLGLRFTTADRLHFGPLANREDAAKFQEGYEYS